MTHLTGQLNAVKQNMVPKRRIADGVANQGRKVVCNRNVDLVWILLLAERQLAHVVGVGDLEITVGRQMSLSTYWQVDPIPWSSIPLTHLFLPGIQSPCFKCENRLLPMTEKSQHAWSIEEGSVERIALEKVSRRCSALVFRR